MKKLNNLFNNIENIQTETDEYKEVLSSAYDNYEKLLTYMDIDSDDGQKIVDNMSQIRKAIDSLDLLARVLTRATTYADEAQRSIDEGVYIEGWDS